MVKAPRTRTEWLADAGAVVSLLLPALFVTMVVRDQTISAHPETAIAVVEKKSLVDTGGEGPVFPAIGYRFTAASGGTFSGRTTRAPATSPVRRASGPSTPSG